MIDFEEKKRMISDAMGGVRYSDIGSQERRDSLKRLVRQLARRRGEEPVPEAVEVAAKMFDEDIGRYCPALRWQEVTLALEWGMNLGEWGDCIRLSAQNLTRCVTKYLESDERKAVVAERRREGDRGGRLTEWEVNLRNWDAACGRARESWDAYAGEGRIGDYRIRREADGKEWARLVLRHCLSNAWRWMLTEGLATDNATRRATCLRNAASEGARGDYETGVYADALMLEWCFRDAVRDGRDLGAEIDAVSRAATDARKMGTALRGTTGRA